MLVGAGGGPTPIAGPRVGVCSAIVVGEHAYPIDLGQDCLTNIPRSGIRFNTIRGVFVTHLHSDRIAELYTLIWLNLDPVNGIGHPLDVWEPGSAGGLPANSDPATPETAIPVVNPDNPAPGPIGYFAASIEAVAYDANPRIRDEGFPDIRTMILPHEIAIPLRNAGRGDRPLRRHDADREPDHARAGRRYPDPRGSRYRVAALARRQRALLGTHRPFAHRRDASRGGG